MTKKMQILPAIFGAVLFCGVTLAQEPAVNIDKKDHPNLAQAQELVAQANRYIVEAQKDNKNDMQLHAQKARQLLVQANQELKLAEQAANSTRGKTKR